MCRTNSDFDHFCALETYLLRNKLESHTEEDWEVTLIHVQKLAIQIDRNHLKTQDTHHCREYIHKLQSM